MATSRPDFSLSQGELNLNSTNLDKFFDSFLAKQEKAKRELIRRNLMILKPQIEFGLAKQNSLISIAAGLETLERLLEKFVADRLNEKRQQKFAIKLDKWLQDYVVLEKRATQNLNKKWRQAGKGFAYQLKKYGGVGESTWGTDGDFALVVKSLITVPDQVQGSGMYLLPATALVPGSLSSGECKQEVTALFANMIKTVCANNPGKSQITLLIPVNCDDDHWRFAFIGIEDGKISRGTLWDSMAYSGLESSSAYKEMQKAIESTNSAIKVTAIASGRQKNGHSCMDYVLQQVLRFMAQTQKLDASLLAICRAQTATELRNAIIAHLTTCVQIRAVNPARVSDQPAALFYTPETGKKEKERHVYSGPRV